MSSGFVSESEIAAAKKRRQEEWEKVRQPEQPVELPETPYDPRSLYERLKEQKDKKDFEYDEAHKLKNLIRGLDDDEVDFLDVIDRAKINADMKHQLEEKNELRDFRQKVASLQEKSLENKLQAEVAKPKPKLNISTRPSQKSILSGLVRKRKVSNGDEKQHDSIKESHTAEKCPKLNSTDLTEDITINNIKNGSLQCIGILPGIGKYTDSSDSDKSTDTDEEYDYSSYDWIGRKLVDATKCDNK